jgi:cell wall-associated NlpC family hydrolase
LWDRWRLGVSAAALAVAVAGGAGDAAGAGAPPVRASAEAVTVLAPGAAAGGTGVVMAFGPAASGGSYRYPGRGDAVAAGLAEAAASKHTGGSPSAEAETTLRHVRLLHGSVRAREIETRVALSAGSGGAVSNETTGSIRGLVVLGRRTAATPGRRLRLGDWGVLDLLSSAPADTGGAIAESITGLRLRLRHDHDGLPAGTVIELGTAHAAVTPPQKDANGGGQQGQSGNQPAGGATQPATGGGRPTNGGNPPTTGATRPAGGGNRPATGATQPPPSAPAGAAKPPATAGRTHAHRAHHRTAHHPRAARAARRDHRLALAAVRSQHLLAAAAGGRARVLAAALAQVGWPYIWGGESRTEGGFDCSGLVDYAYARAGLALPGRPTAAVLWRMSRPVGRARLQPGDLAFLYTRRRAPYHVALYAGDGLIVVAPHTGAKVTIEPIGSVRWDGYGRLLQGGRGDGLAASVAAAARRFAQPGPIQRRRLAIQRAADALAARRVLPAGLELGALRSGRADAGAAAGSVAPAPPWISPVEMRASAPAAAGRPLGIVLLVLLAAVCAVRVCTGTPRVRLSVSRWSRLAPTHRLAAARVAVSRWGRTSG